MLREIFVVLGTIAIIGAVAVAYEIIVPKGICYEAGVTRPKGAIVCGPG